MSIEFSNGFSIVKNTPVVAVDSIRAQLTVAQQTTYDSANVGDWIKVTQTQYNNIINNISGATKKGNSDVQLSTRDVLTPSGTVWHSFGLSGTPTFQIDSGEYIIGMVSEAWNSNAGYTQLGYTTTFNGNTITNIGGQAGTSTGGGRDYYIRKAPTDSATETRYPVLKMTVTGNGVTGWRGYTSNNNGASWTQAADGYTMKIQLITTSTKSW